MNHSQWPVNTCRPDSTDLGADWVEEEGEWEIVDEQLHAQVSGAYAVGTTDSFSETVYTLETRFRATGSLNQWYNTIALGFGGTDEGIESTGHSVTYIPVVPRLGVAKPSPGCLGLNPQAEQP